MKKFRGITTFAAGLALTMVIVLLQFAWNLRSPQYLTSIAQRAGTSMAVAAVLPEYAASKLPEPEVAKAAFTKQVTASRVQEVLDSLYTSITEAYVGKTDVIQITITSLTIPIKANGYQIPPGTVFANDTIQVSGLAGVLRSLQRSIVPVLLISAVLLGVAVLVGIKRGIVPSLRNVLLVVCLLLGGLVVATLIIPGIIASLVTSSGLDATLRDILLKFIDILVSDAGRYYVTWIIVLLLAVIGLSVWSMLTHRARRPNKKAKSQPVPVESKPKEL